MLPLEIDEVKCVRTSLRHSRGQLLCGSKHGSNDALPYSLGVRNPSVLIIENLVRNRVSVPIDPNVIVASDGGMEFAGNLADLKLTV